MLKLAGKFGESKWNPFWLTQITSSTGTNYVLNEHEDFDQYGSFTTSSRKCHIKATLQVWWIYWIYWLSYRANKDDGNRQTETDRGEDNNPSAEEAEVWKQSYHNGKYLQLIWELNNKNNSEMIQIMAWQQEIAWGWYKISW